MVCSNGLPAISEEDDDVEATSAVLCPLPLFLSVVAVAFLVLRRRCFGGKDEEEEETLRENLKCCFLCLCRCCRVFVADVVVVVECILEKEAS